MDNQLHELFDIASKVDGMFDIEVDDGGKMFAVTIDKDGNNTIVDDSMTDLLLGVHTLIDMINDM